MKQCILAALTVLATAGPLQAQGLRDKISQLFIFGPDDNPLFLGGSADPNSPTGVQAHAEHFVPSAVANNASLISFLETAIGANIANLPLGSTSSGFTFRLEGGTLVQSSTSPGPIFAERAQTLGRGRLLIAANVNKFRFKSMRGVDMENIRLNFTHQNADFAGCDTIFGGDCTLYGIPRLENDFIQLSLSLDVDVTAYSFLMTYGLHDRVDIGVAIPVLSTRLRGTSRAEVVPFGGPTVVHFFDGTEDDPVLSATRSIEGSASGIGDIATRLKIRVSDGPKTSFAIMGDARFPTGNANDLLGSGDFAMRGMGILSASFDQFSPHANVGYVYRNSDLQNDAVLATIGFDQMLAPWAAMAVDFVSEIQVGDSKLQLPGDVSVDVPFRRTIESTTIPDMRDDLLNGSLGFKFVTSSGITIVANTIWPLNRGGVRPTVMWTTGLEYNF